MSLDLDAIEARANAASKGKWVHSAYDGGWDCVRCENAIIAKLGQNHPENATFIAHARTDVPALVAEVRRLQASLREAEGAHAELWAERNGMQAMLQASEASCAAMRESLVECLGYIDRMGQEGVRERAQHALSPDSGSEILRELAEAKKERDTAIHEREACHALYDDILALCGYAKGQGYPGIVGAVEKLHADLLHAEHYRGNAEAERNALRAAGDALAEALRCAAERLPEFASVRATIKSALAGWEATKPQTPDAPRQ